MTVRGPASEVFIDQMRRAMDVISKRQQLVASNVGNIDTPGYKTIDLDFDKALDRAVSEMGLAGAPRGTHAQSGPDPISDPTGREVAGLDARSDGNNVSLEREMMNLAQTRHRYDIAANALRQRIHMLRFAIMEGKSG